MTDQAASADTLVELLEAQQALVEELSLLAARQPPLIEAGESDGLLALLADRQRILDRLFGDQERISQLAASLDHPAGRLGGEARARISRVAAAISGRLSQIVRSDEEDQVLIGARSQRASRTMAKLDTAKQAHSAYLRSRAVSNRFADRKG
ncbi:MAG: hypothetical protein IH888_03505 [Planctomycetes bacterium]|nr:hypothetical protein [Planctomycetota bacterium]